MKVNGRLMLGGLLMPMHDAVHLDSLITPLGYGASTGSASHF